MKKYSPYIFGIGFLLLSIYTLDGLQGTCNPWDTLSCDTLKKAGNDITISGQMKETITGVNFGKYNPEVYIDEKRKKTPLVCTQQAASFSKPKISMVLQCNFNLDSLKKGQTLVVNWDVETTQPYSVQALYEEERMSELSSAYPRTCSDKGANLVCKIRLNAKIPVN